MGKKEEGKGDEEEVEGEEKRQDILVGGLVSDLKTGLNQTKLLPFL